MSMKLQSSRGLVGLVGLVVDSIAEKAQKSLVSSLRDQDSYSAASPPYHITLLSKAELRGLSKEQLAGLPGDINPESVFNAGIGGDSSIGVFFVVVIWAVGQQLRKSLNLPPKQFHITLSDRDDHDMDKGINSLLPGQFPDAPSPDFLDHLAFTLHMAGQYRQEQPFCINLIQALPDSHRGFLRLADAARWTEQYKLSMLSYACAFQRTADEKVRGYCVKKLVECSKRTEWECLFVESELLQLPDKISSMLLAPWPSDLRSLLSDMNIVTSLCLESRERLFVPLQDNLGPISLDGSFRKLPRNFRWLIPFHIAIMSTPRCDFCVSHLYDLLTNLIGMRMTL